MTMKVCSTILALDRSNSLLYECQCVVRQFFNSLASHSTSHNHAYTYTWCHSWSLRFSADAQKKRANDLLADYLLFSDPETLAEGHVIFGDCTLCGATCVLHLLPAVD
jgi:hypothetical protein